MKRCNIPKLAFVVGMLLVAAIASRWWLMDWPNFKPVCAIAIYLGFFCQSRWVAAVSVTGIMLISDSIIGFYSLPLMAAVYLSMLLAIGIGVVLQQKMQKTESTGLRLGMVCIGMICGSLLFFVVTNAAVCLLTPWYPNSLLGLANAFVAGIPFFKFTVSGDVLFGLLLYASHFLAQSVERRFWTGLPQTRLSDANRF